VRGVVIVANLLLPSSLLSISMGAFANTSLQSIIIHNTVITLGGKEVFGLCKSLTTVTLSYSISTIEKAKKVSFICASVEYDALGECFERVQFLELQP